MLLTRQELLHHLVTVTAASEQVQWSWHSLQLLLQVVLSPLGSKHGMEVTTAKHQAVPAG